MCRDEIARACREHGETRAIRRGAGGISTHPEEVAEGGNLHGGSVHRDGGELDGLDVIGKLGVAVATTLGVIGLVECAPRGHFLGGAIETGRVLNRVGVEIQTGGKSVASRKLS